MPLNHGSAGRTLLLLAVLSVGMIPAQDGKAPPALALMGGLVMTAPDWEPKPANVVIDRGRIVGFGPGIAAPEGATVIQLKGATIAPAWIDACSEGLFDTTTTTARQATGAEALAADMLLAFDDRAARLHRRAGVGLVYADPRPGAGRVTGGTGSVIVPALDGGWPQVRTEVAGISYTLLGRGGGSGTTSRRPRGLPRGLPFPTGRSRRARQTRNAFSHQAAIRSIETGFTGAERYKKTWDKFEKDLAEYEKKLAEWKKKGGKDTAEAKPEAKEPKARPATRRSGGFPEGFREWPRDKRREWMRENLMGSRRRNSTPATPEKKADTSGRPKRPLEPKREPALERLLEVMDAKAAFRCEAHWKEDIGAALDLAEKRKLRLVLIGGSEAAMHADRLAKAEAVVVLGVPRPRNHQALLFRGTPQPAVAASLYAAGVPIAFGTAEQAGIGDAHVALVASLAIAEGLSEQAALDALTIGAARAVGLNESVGRVAVGQAAFLQIVDGHPLDPDVKRRGVVLGGRWHASESGGDR